MNLLVDALPETVEIGGKSWPIETNFRVWLRCMLASEDNALTEYEKQIIFLMNIFPNKRPDDVRATIEQIQWFMNGGIVYDKKYDGPRTFSFQKDAGLIYAAFQQTHGIDLQNVELHWWQFLALIRGLDSESNFRQLVSLRHRLKTGRATKEERRAALEMGEFFDVPEIDDRSIEEREAERRFDEAVAEGMRRRAANG